MLINTVVLLLRELLPLVVLVSLLLALYPEQCRRALALVALVAGPLLLLQSSFYSELSDAFDGLGLELWYACCYLSCAFGIGVALWWPSPRWPSVRWPSRRWLSVPAPWARVLTATGPVWAIGLALVSLLLVNGSNLVLYLAVYPRQSEENQALWLGVALGSGISISIGVLLFHLASELSTKWRALAQLVLCLNAARQCSAALAILQQSDWLGSAPAWDSQRWLQENSELGYFLNALLGYEASPGYWQLAGYLLVVTILWFVRNKGQKDGG